MPTAKPLRRIAKMPAEHLLHLVVHYHATSERNMARFQHLVAQAAQIDDQHHRDQLRQAASESLIRAVDLWNEAVHFLAALEAGRGKAPPEIALALHYGIGPAEITPSQLHWALRRLDAIRRDERAERKSVRVHRKSFAEREAHRERRALMSTTRRERRMAQASGVPLA